MKKRKFKNYLILGTLFLGISFLLWNCEKEDNLFSHDESSLINHNSHSRYVTVDEIPSVIKFLEQKTSNHLGHASKNDSENTIAFDEIIEVIDILQGNKNYTFNITNIQQYVNNQISLYNLIVSTDSLGNAEEPYVLKYTLDKDFAIDYIKGIKTISEFKGEIAIVSVETFLANHTSYTSRNSICPEEPIFSNTNPGSGGGTTGGNGTGSSTGSTPSCSWVETGQYLPCGCGGNADGHAPSGPSCCAGSVAITTFQCNYTPNKSTSKTDDSGCPEPTEGNVAVLLGIDYFQALIEIMGDRLTEDIIEWLSVQEDETLEREIVIFLEENNSSPEALEFVEEAIEALMNGAEVGFEDRIIIEPSVPECVKNIISKIQTNNVYVDLGDMPDFVKEELNLSGQVMEIFNNSDKYHLNFKVEFIPPNSQGEILNAKTHPRHNPITQEIFFDITLNTNYVSSATDLAIARTIIHESLHAYISYRYHTELFSSLSTSLRHLLSQNGNNQNTAQHILMAQNFVGNVARSLESWDDSSLSDSNYYDYLSWSGGMISTPAFNTLPLTFQQNSINANLAEETTNSNALGQKKCN